MIKSDAWGKIISTDSASNAPYYALMANPLRYRGYIYDTETGFYYLQSRYYDPEVGRFINADSIVPQTTGSCKGYNLYAYCFNNPVNMSDSTGNWPTWDDVKKNLDQFNENVVQPIVNLALELPDIILNNISASGGICIGIGFATDYYGAGVEAITYMDIIGFRYENQEFKIGSNGRSALTISDGLGTVGPQSETYEDIYNTMKRTEYDDSYYDIGSSVGSAKAFIIGYHYNFSISYLGIINDIMDVLNW